MQIEVLEAVVEDVDRAAQLRLGEPARQVAAAGDEHGDAVERARQHQRLVPRSIEIGADARRIADDDDAVDGGAAAVAAAENRRPLAGVAQERGRESGQRRLGTAAGGEIADTDDRPIEPTPAETIGGVAR